MKLSPAQSLAGILEPVFAIRTEDDLGIGDTEGVRQMINWCHRHHLNIFQTLPINEISDDNSPYNAISSLAIEPTTIAISPGHIPDLAPKKFHELATPEVLAELHSGPVNYPKVKALKRALLHVAFESFLKRHFNKNSGTGVPPVPSGTGFQPVQPDAAHGQTGRMPVPLTRADQFRAFLQQNAE